MKLNELIEKYSREAVDVEVYSFIGKRKSIHTDNILSIDEYDGTELVENYEIMDEEDYNNSILANSCESADFGTWYGDENAKVLVVII